MGAEIFQIAIDGPSGAGKSTIAKEIAKKLKIDYVDTGAMYRAIAFKMIMKGISAEDMASLEDMLLATDIKYKGGDLHLDGTLLKDQIRTAEVTKLTSEISGFSPVREKLVALQQAMGKSQSLVMDGRDIGTNVFPNAKYKFYLNASVKERARRRWAELKEKGEEADLEIVEKAISERDLNDAGRALNPLRKAHDAIEIDSTSMSIDQVVNFIIETIS